MLVIFLLAAVEELIKYAIAKFTIGTRFSILGLNLFFLVEAAFKIGETSEHAYDLGVSYPMAYLAGLSVAVGSSVFHLYTNIGYSKTNLDWRSLAIFTVLHTIYNYVVMGLPAFEIQNYVLLPWVISTICGLIIAAWVYYHRRQRRPRS